MFQFNPLWQVIITLIILLFMGYFAYNIYSFEYDNMLKNKNNIKKEINIINGIYDYKASEFMLNGYDKSRNDYVDINPSINQEGGAEYSYNFWLYINKENLDKINDAKDFILFLKGEKNIYYSDYNYNCSTKSSISTDSAKLLIKNPLVRLKKDGTAMVVEFNNIYNPDSYKNRTRYIDCKEADNDWNKKNKNMLGVYNLDFNRKWFMVTIVMKEVADSNNILLRNRASCKIFINSINVLNQKAETKYNDKVYSSTFKNNTSPFYINPVIGNDNVKVNNKNYLNNNNITDFNTIKIADLKYFNYAIDNSKIAELYSNGFSKSPAIVDKNADEIKYHMVTDNELEKSEIKEL